MLELAAKACGLELRFRALTNMPGAEERPRIVHENGVTEKWNPLEDDGDALRLAVKINEVRMFIYPNEVSMGCLEIVEKYAGDPMPAARRAIVRAAAEIGKAMP